MTHAVLIIEDESTLAKNLTQYLVRHGFDARAAGSAEEGFALLDEYRPDIILLDFHLPGMNGLRALEKLRQRDASSKVILMTGHGSIQMAVDAMRAGAHDYLTKPIVLSELKLRLMKAVDQERKDQALSYYQQREGEQGHVGELIGESQPMRALRARIQQLLVAERRLTEGEPPAVLITGETGTGKELVARALHYDGKRRDKPFIDVNCASIPGPLLESELFGYERGAFTDARDRKLGLAEAADEGTLFLDEIGDAELSLQGKLLRLLEDKVVRRLGSVRDVKVNVRVVAATNQPLERRVRDQRFRSDLFFRLRGVQLELPPLRERGEDVLLLARHFLASHGARYGKHRLDLSSEAERILLDYAWPGNVRELRNTVEQMVLLADGDVVRPSHINLCATLGRAEAHSAEGAPEPAAPHEGFKLEDWERTLVTKALDKTSWNVTRAAKLLGLSRDTLRYRIEKYSLTSPWKGMTPER
jgi:two-component system, NtrC family, response regulator AtoC